MTRIAADVDIEAPVERVFSVVCDADRLGDWIELHDGVDEAPRLPLRPGAEFEQQLTVKGARVAIVWRATAVHAPSHVEWVGEAPGGATAKATVRLEPAGDGRTRLQYVCDYDPPGGIVGAVADRVAGRQAATEEAEASFDRLRRLLADG